MQFYGFEALNVQKYYFTHVYARGMKMQFIFLLACHAHSSKHSEGGSEGVCTLT